MCVWNEKDGNKWQNNFNYYYFVSVNNMYYLFYYIKCNLFISEFQSNYLYIINENTEQRQWNSGKLKKKLSKLFLNLMALLSIFGYYHFRRKYYKNNYLLFLVIISRKIF